MIFYRCTRQPKNKLALNVPLVAEGGESTYWKNVISGRLQYEQNEKIETICSFLMQHQDWRNWSEGLRNFNYLQTAQSQMLKEYVFEHIRLSEFPGKPSRRFSTFAFSRELDPVQYLQHMGLDSSQFHVLEIELVGARTTWHQAKQAHLNCNHLLAIEMENEARSYWNGSSVISYSTEILISGRYKINQIVWSGSDTK